MKKLEIEMSDYVYDLPQDRIASYPVERRDASKLLLYNKGNISHSHFYNLPSFIDPDTLLIFNNTRVVPARLFFRKPTGAMIEIFCLEPIDPKDYALSFASTGKCVWKTIVGNKKRWKGEPIPLYIPDENHLELISISLKARLIERIENSYVVEFTWDGDMPFSKVMELCGRVPIPPYLNRESEAIDVSRYQTLYAKYRGSVAAPTAGLHFTEDVINSLKAKGVDCENVCLHVGAGTFLPVKSESISGHIMHSEPFSISSILLNKLYNSIGNKDIIAVGTTSVRTLESIYYLGLQCMAATPSRWTPSPVEQWDPYNLPSTVPDVREAIASLLEYMDINKLDHLVTRTRIIIAPSFKYRIVNKLITNFHQPQSTLLLLIAAFIGEDWRKVYSYALNNGFRFLSYGDSSLLMPK